MKKGGSNFKIENNVLKGNEILFQIDYPSLGGFVLDRLENSPDFVGQIDAITGKKYTYEKMRERSIRCALWMRSQGLLPGDVVAICSHNQMDISITCFAAVYIGAVFSPWDPTLNRADCRHLLNLVKPKIAFVGETSLAAFAESAQEASPDLKIIVFGQLPGFLEFENVIAEPEAKEIDNFACAEIESLDNIAAIICSSGTTGMPKGVALNHRTWLIKICEVQRLPVGGGSCVVFSSTSWISWAVSVFVNLALSLTDIVVPPFEEYAACALIEKYKPSWVLFASSMVNRLLKSDALEKCDFSCLRHVFYAGAPLAVSSHEAFSKFLPNAMIFVAYGMTEIGGTLSTGLAGRKSGSSGKIITNGQLKIMNPTTGEILGPNQRGELVIKTGTMMNSYYNDPQATAESVDGEGWFHSGDLGYYDEDGEIFVLDRLKELIKYRGYQVSPVEIESVILSHPGVKEVAVVGVPHPVDDEHPIAFVVKAEDYSNSGKEVTETELMNLVATELSDSKRLRGGLRFLDRLPKSASDKIRRKQLRDLASSYMVRMDSDTTKLPMSIYK